MKRPKKPRGRESKNSQRPQQIQEPPTERGKKHHASPPCGSRTCRPPTSCRPSFLPQTSCPRMTWPCRTTWPSCRPSSSAARTWPLRIGHGGERNGGTPRRGAKSANGNRQEREIESERWRMKRKRGRAAVSILEARLRAILRLVRSQIASDSERRATIPSGPGIWALT